jgi:hypothetical protein
MGSPWSSAKQNKRFLLLFLEKEENHKTNWLLWREQKIHPQKKPPSFWGKRPTPLGQLRQVISSPWSSAKQNKRFLLLFLEKEEDDKTNWFLGGFAEKADPWTKKNIEPLASSNEPESGQ